MAGQLLAVDLGYRTGLAVFRPDGRLRSYRSQNLGTRRRLKRAAADAGSSRLATRAQSRPRW